MLALNTFRASLPDAVRMASWKSRSADRPASVANEWRRIAERASFIAFRSFRVLRSAANPAAAGSTTERSSKRLCTKWGSGSPANAQARTSGSRRFQRLRGSTRVPILGRLSTSPFAVSTCIASRYALRDTSSASENSTSLDNMSPGANSPERIAVPSL